MRFLHITLSRRFIVLLILGITLVAAAHAANGAAAVVKAPAPIRIDGKGEEWAVTATHPVMTPNGVVGTFKLAWSPQACYVLIEVTDASPRKNTATMPEDVFKRGDAVGLCFGPTDAGGVAQRLFLADVAGRPVALLQRPAATEKKPHRYAVTAERGVTLDYVAVAPEVGVAFGDTPDGYRIEAGIPWRLLGYTPAEGLEFPFDVQLVFSDPAGTANTAVAWWHSDGPQPNTTTDMPTEAQLYPQFWGRARLLTADPGPQPAVKRFSTLDPEVFTGPGTPITFTLPRAARVSLVIRNADATGWIVRELLRARPLTRGDYTAYWNGRDRWGDPCPPGEYTYTLAMFDGLKATFRGSAGNDGHPVYRTADGRGSIGGVHGGPWVVAADDSGIYAFYAWQEGPPPYRKITPSGDQLWAVGYQHVPQAVTAADGAVYLVYGDTKSPVTLIRLDPKSGRPMPAPGAERPWSQVVLGMAPVEGLAVLNGRAYFSVPVPAEEPPALPDANADEQPLDDAGAALPEEAKDKVVGYIGVLNLQTGKQEPRIPIHRPLGLAALDAEHILVCTANQVVAVAVADGGRRPFATNLNAPRAVAVDPDNGWVYVAELGATQQIRKYDRGGKLLATFGKRGGRPGTVTTYDPLQFRNVVGLAIGPKHELWAVERGIAPRRFIRLTSEGQWVGEIRGPSHWHTTVIADLDDPSSLSYFVGDHLVRAKMDLAAYAKNGGMPAWSVEGIYNLTEGADSPGAPFKPTGGFDTTTGAGVAFTADNGHRYLFLDSRWHSRHAMLCLWEQNRWKPVATIANRGASKTWADTNGNGRVEAEELGAAPQPTGGWAWIDRDLTLHGEGGTLHPAAIGARGVPDYRQGTYEPLAPAGAMPDLADKLAKYDIIFPGKIDADGAQYFAANLGPGPGRSAWDRAAENRLIKVQGGAVQWMVGNHRENFLFQHIAGVVDGVVLVPDVQSKFWAYATDGLALGHVMSDPLGPNAAYVELFNGLFYKDRASGKRLLVFSTTEDARLVEISGVFGKDIQRRQGKLTLAAPQPCATETTRNYTLRYQTWPKFLGRNNICDAYGWEWAPETDVAAIRDGKRLAGEVRLRRDAGQLCVFASLLDPTPLPELAAVAAYGKAPGVEILIGPAAPERTAPASGDSRIFLAVGRTDGKPVGRAYLVRPASSPIPVDPQLRGLQSRGDYAGDVGPQPLDCQREWVGIPGAVVGVYERYDGTGYRLEAEIPLAVLPELVVERGVHIVRSPNTDRIDQRHDLLETPCRLNLAVHLTDGTGGVRRVAWMPDGQTGFDPRAMNPAQWGWCNAGVRLDWSPVQDALAYRVYRAPTERRAELVVAITNATGTTAMDLPGAGTFNYWLAPLYANGEGQWIGPVRAEDARAVFPWCESAPALSPAALTDLVVDAAQVCVANLRLPGATAVAVAPVKGLVVTPVSRGNDVWSLVIATPAAVPVGSRFSLALTVTRGGADEPQPVNVTTRLTPLLNLASASARRDPAPQAPAVALPTLLDPVDGETAVAPFLDEPLHQWIMKRSNDASVQALAVPGQPWPVAYFSRKNLEAEYAFVPADGVTRWRLEGRVKFAQMYNAGQPAAITLLDGRRRQIASLVHARGEGPWPGHRQYLALNGRVFYDSNANIDPVRGEWQPFVIRLAGDTVTLQFGAGYNAEAPVPKDADWRKPAAVRLSVVSAGLWVSGLRLTAE